MKHVYYLKTCDTCKRIMKEVGVDGSFELQNIKESLVSENQLEELRGRVGSYEELFNKQSRVYKSEKLKEKYLTEVDIKNWILKEYTLLKRPIFLFDDVIFIGNSKKNVESLQEYLNT